jgi:hypothetical protein
MAILLENNDEKPPELVASFTGSTGRILAIALAVVALTGISAGAWLKWR